MQIVIPNKVCTEFLHFLYERRFTVLSIPQDEFKQATLFFTADGRQGGDRGHRSYKYERARDDRGRDNLGKFFGAAYFLGVTRIKISCLTCIWC